MSNPGTAKVTDDQKIMLRLIERSRDTEDGWRKVSDPLWRHVVEQSHSDLVELDHENKRVRFSQEGVTVMKYLP
jgi:hypothetical protein